MASQLGLCRCGGFVPATAATCPHCSRSRSRSSFDRLRLGALGGAIGGGAIAFTLMACYGAPPCDDNDTKCERDNSIGTDSGSTTTTDARSLADVTVSDGSSSGSDTSTPSDASDSGDAGDAGDAGD